MGSESFQERTLNFDSVASSYLPLHQISMAPLTKATAPLVRSWTRHALPSIRPAPAALTQQKRGRADVQAPSSSSPSSSFDSPFHRSGGTQRETTNIPDWSKYKSGRDEVTNRVFQYFMVGAFGALTAMGAKATVQGQSVDT